MSSSSNSKPVNFLADHYRIVSELMNISVLESSRYPNSNSSSSSVDSVAQKLLQDISKVKQKEKKVEGEDKEAACESREEESWTLVFPNKRFWRDFAEKSRVLERTDIGHDYYEELDYDDLQDHSFSFLTAQPEWQPRNEPLRKSMERMEKNSWKAVIEHRRKSQSKTYMLPQELFVSIQQNEAMRNNRPLLFFSSESTDVGGREEQEDAHFFLEEKDHILTGLFDGHSGRLVADYVCKYFPKKFKQIFGEVDENVHRAFEQTINEIQKSIAKKRELHSQGSTAVVCYIDKKRGLIYTATLGDSEANIYREIDGQRKSIPLSCVRDWSSKKDARRIAVALSDPSIAEKWPTHSKPKHLRYPAIIGVNLSRCFGDVGHRQRSIHPTIIHKPKITVQKYFSGDIIMLACDGLKDYVSEDEIVQQIKETRSYKHLASNVVKHAVKTSKDNVSVIAIRVFQMSEDYCQALRSI